MGHVSNHKGRFFPPHFMLHTFSRLSRVICCCCCCYCCSTDSLFSLSLSHIIHLLSHVTLTHEAFRVFSRLNKLNSVLLKWTKKKPTTKRNSVLFLFTLSEHLDLNCSGLWVALAWNNMAASQEG